jgi:cell division protein FtsI/penicillin-binding protein 2
MRVLRLIDNNQKLQSGTGPLFALGTAAVILLVACTPSVLSRQRVKASTAAAPAPVASTTKSADVQHLNPAIADLVANDDTTNEDPEVRAAALAALGDRAGAVVVMDAKSGRLYSVVNQEWALKKDWTPASLMKVVSSMVALDQGLFDPADELKVDGSTQRMKFRDAFARSDNSYFRMVAEKAGADRILEYAVNLGLGQRTGVNYSGEAAGQLPVSADVRLAGRMGAYGEGVRVTPMQLATMFAAIGNGGTLLTPQAVLSDAVQPRVRRTLAIPSTTIATLQAAMVETVERGTGSGAHVDGFSIGGKTGSTDAKSGSTGLFASYSPVNNPRIVVMVLTQGRKENGLAASTIAGAIYKAIGKRFQLDR